MARPGSNPDTRAFAYQYNAQKKKRKKKSFASATSKYNTTPVAQLGWPQYLYN